MKFLESFLLRQICKVFVNIFFYFGGSELKSQRVSFGFPYNSLHSASKSQITFSLRMRKKKIWYFTFPKPKCRTRRDKDGYNVKRDTCKQKLLNKVFSFVKRKRTTMSSILNGFYKNFYDSMCCCCFQRNSSHCHFLFCMSSRSKAYTQFLWSVFNEASNGKTQSHIQTNRNDRN